MADRTIAHGDFVLEKTYPVPPERVFAAYADPAIKARWFGDPGEAQSPGRVFEFRVGGREYMAGKGPGGAAFTFDARYLNIVPDVRIIYAYDMTMDGRPISASLAALEFVPVAGGTRFIVTEHGVFLDGLDTLEQRREGTEFLLEALGGVLQ
jgi:uncharacterized protein YndB with AHSA1/START domain